MNNIPHELIRGYFTDTGHTNNRPVPTIFFSVAPNKNVSKGATADFMSISLIAGPADRLTAAE